MRQDRFPRDFYAPKSFVYLQSFEWLRFVPVDLNRPSMSEVLWLPFLALGLAVLAAWSALIASTPLTSVAATKSPLGRDFRMSAY